MALYSYFIELLNSVKQSNPQKGGGRYNLKAIFGYTLGLGIMLTAIAFIPAVGITPLASKYQQNTTGFMFPAGLFTCIFTQAFNGDPNGNFFGIINPDVPIVPTTENTTDDLPVATAVVNETYMLPII